jgi:hypothetical protein
MVDVCANLGSSSSTPSSAFHEKMERNFVACTYVAKAATWPASLFILVAAFITRPYLSQQRNLKVFELGILN